MSEKTYGQTYEITINLRRISEKWFIEAGDYEYYQKQLEFYGTQSEAMAACIKMWQTKFYCAEGPDQLMESLNGHGISQVDNLLFSKEW